DPESCQAIRGLIAATGLPVVETFQGAGVVSRDLEDHYLGRVGLFCNQPGDVIVEHADVLITVGYDAVEYDPALWNTDVARTIVHIDSVPADIDNNYQPTLELRGDVAATVSALSQSLAGLTVSEVFREEIDHQRDMLADIDTGALSSPPTELGLNPAAVILRLRAELDDDATIA